MSASRYCLDVPPNSHNKHYKKCMESVRIINILILGLCVTICTVSVTVRRKCCVTIQIIDCEQSLIFAKKMWNVANSVTQTWGLFCNLIIILFTSSFFNRKPNWKKCWRKWNRNVTKKQKRWVVFNKQLLCVLEVL